MLKSLTFAAAVALVLGASSVSFAGGILHKSYPSAQCETASPQSIAPSPQGECGAPACGPVKKHHLAGLMAKLHKPKCYTYEWVLKKKRVHGGCGTPACESCETTYPSAQYPSAQGWAAPQAAATGQYAPTSSGQIAPAAPAAVEPPAAPEMPKAPAPPTASNGVLFLTPAGN